MSSAKHILLTIKIFEDEGQFAAECMELGTATCGDTFEEAYENIKEAIEAHLAALDELGLLNKTLKEKGIKVKERTRKTQPLKRPIYPNSFTTVYEAAVGS